MSANKAEIAGNYAVSGGSGDPEFVADRLADFQAEQSVARVEATAAESGVAEAIEGTDPDVIDVSVGGETIPCDPIGLGQRARIMKRATEADERGDEMKQVEVVLDMIDLLVSASPPEYGTEWWDAKTETEVRSAFQTLSQQSAGGTNAGK